MIRTIALAAILIALSGCTTVHEQLIRNNYLAVGKAPTGWAPKTSLCPQFHRNGWADHPPEKDGCFAPRSKAETKAEPQKPQTAAKG